MASSQHARDQDELTDSENGSRPISPNRELELEYVADDDLEAADSPTTAAATTDCDDDTGDACDDDPGWQALAQLDSLAFARAIAAAEEEIERRHTPTSNQQQESTAAATRDINAFEQWTKRIARLQVLDVDEEMRRAEEQAAPSSGASEVDPEASQLLRCKIMLAQEEAKNVDLEDRVSRLMGELAHQRAENEELQRANTVLTAKNLQQLASSSGGAIRLQNETLKEHNSALKKNLRACEHQLQHLAMEVDSLRRGLTSPKTCTDLESTPSPDELPPADSSSSAPPLTNSSSPSLISPTISVGGASTADLGSNTAFPSALTLLRVRCALSLARATLRHQSELDHLMQYKVAHLTLQTAVDDGEDALDIERELLTFEQAEHARTRAQVAVLQADEAALQQVVAHLAQQLQKYIGSQGLGMSVSMSPAPNAPPAKEVEEAATATATTAAVTAEQPAVVATATPSKKGAKSIAPATPQSSSGWGLGWVFGSAQKQAAAEQARQAAAAAAAAKLKG